MSCAIALQHFYGRKTFELNNKNVLYKKGTHERAMNIFLKLTIFLKSHLVTDLSVTNSRMVFVHVYNLNGSGTDQKKMRLKIKLKC